MLDCLRTTIDEEGFSGLYKGFGALILQYGLQILIIRTMKIVLEKSPFGTGSNGSTPISGASTPPLLVGQGQEKVGPAYPGSSTPPVHQSRSEPLNISNNSGGARAAYEPLNSSTRRTPPAVLNMNR